MPGPITGTYAANGDGGITIMTAAGEDWLGTNYNASSGKTIYVRYSMVFNDLNNENGGGGGYGGLQFLNGGNERLITGNGWASTNWSTDLAGNQQDLNPPLLPVVLGEWHTIVMRVTQVAGGNDTASIYFDPNFALPESQQTPFQITGDVSFDNIRLRVGNGTASATWSNIVVSAISTGVGFAAEQTPTFQAYVPDVGYGTAAPTSPVGVQVIFGSYGIGTNSVVMTLDGNNVTPTFVVTSNSITMSYQPGSPFALGSVHNVSVSVTDSNATTFSTSWSFTVDSYPTLPVTLQASTNGTVDVTGGGVGTTIWTAGNGWTGGNYGPNSTNTLYTRFTMNFQDLNNETGSGGGFGGLHFYQGNDEVLIVGNNWGSTNWSLQADHPGLISPDLLPVVPVVLGEWHTMVVKMGFVSNADDNVTIWFDPDFTKTEDNQTNAPLTFTADVSFDNVHLRAGNGSAYAQFTNIVVAATAPGVGFATVVPPAVMSIQKSGGNVNVSWTSSGMLQIAPAVTGPWTDISNAASPQSIPITNAMQFYRIKQ